jgi:TonB-dependent starch-binding outer membrane protein SusC
VLIASEGNPQTNQKLDDIVLSLDITNMTLKNVFDQITERTDLKFAYEEGTVKVNQKIDLESSPKSLTNILKGISQENRLSFKRIGDQIFVQKHKGEPSVEDVKQTVADVDISGKITDENGEGLPGASVVVKGTTNGITTNLDGNYKLTVPDNATLLISFVGYKTIEMAVGAQSVIDIQLDLDASQLEEVVVIGYGTQQRRDLTGAIASANLKDKSNTANVDIGQALQGLMAGVNVGVATQAGGSPEIEIRGQNSLSGSQSPLIILDGIIFNGDLSNINVSDVATLDILKDASAAAVYGARASNGVILITTKKGKSEKASFSFNAYKGVQDLSPTDATQIMDEQQFLQRLIDYPHQEQLYKWYDSYQKNVLAGTTPPDQSTKPVVATPSTPEELEVYFRSPEEADNFRQGISRNWIDETLRETAIVQNYDLSVSGRSKSSSYYLSGTYTEQEGLNENDQFERATMRANFTSDVKDWLSLGLNSAYSFRDYSGIEAPLDRAMNASPWGSLRQGPDPDDPTQYYTEVVAEDGVIQNPLSNTTAENDDLRDNIFIALKAKIDIP